jgi:phosphohistidine phosphatase
MVFYFLRHAAAGNNFPNPSKDERRSLDEEGTLQARYVGRLLANLDVQVDQIVSSPLKRALQTATLVANELAYEAALQTHDALRPEGEWDQFQQLAQQYRKHDSVLLVGHNPSMAEFLSKIISASGAARVELKKASIAKVEMSGRLGTLQWLVTPKIARSLQMSLKLSSRPKTPRK